MIETKKGLPGLKAARESKGLSQSALARALEVPERQVQRWESCESAPSVWAALSAAQVLETTVEDLLQGPVTLLLPDPDNTHQMANLAHVISLARIVAATVTPAVEAKGMTPYRGTLARMIGLALKEAEGVYLSMKVQNKPAAMNSLRVLADMTFSLGYIAEVPTYRDYRACLLMIEGPRRKLALFDLNLGGVPMDHPTALEFRASIEGEIKQFRDYMAKLDRAPDDPDHWTSKGKERGISAKKRATAAKWPEAYDFLYEMGSGYVHGDGFALEDFDKMQASELKGIPEMTAIMIMNVIGEVLDELPEVEKVDGVIAGWNAFAQRNQQDAEADGEE